MNDALERLCVLNDKRSNLLYIDMKN